MSRALRLVDVTITDAPEAAPLSTLVPTLGYSTRASLAPTLSPGARATLVPSLTGSRATEPPTTQRSATVHPRYETAARREAMNLLAVMRLNLDFVQSLMQGQAAAFATDVLADLHESVERLERRLSAATFCRCGAEVSADPGVAVDPGRVERHRAETSMKRGVTAAPRPTFERPHACKTGGS